MVVHLDHIPWGANSNPMKVIFFLWSNFFVMDKERTMRVPKARAYGAQPLMRAPKAQSYGTRHSLHDRAVTFASLLYKAEKPSVRPSVHPSRWHLAISPWIDIKFARYEAPVLGEHGVLLLKGSNPCCSPSMAL